MTRSLSETKVVATEMSSTRSGKSAKKGVVGERRRPLFPIRFVVLDARTPDDSPDSAQSFEERGTRARKAFIVTDFREVHGPRAIARLCGSIRHDKKKREAAIHAFAAANGMTASIRDPDLRVTFRKLETN
jgi:hypothetical protein